MSQLRIIHQVSFVGTGSSPTLWSARALLDGPRPARDEPAERPVAVEALATGSP